VLPFVGSKNKDITTKGNIISPSKTPLPFDASTLKELKDIEGILNVPCSRDLVVGCGGTETPFLWARVS
jgi:hypothetical protein